VELDTKEVGLVIPVQHAGQEKAADRNPYDSDGKNTRNPHLNLTEKDSAALQKIHREVHFVRQ